MPFIPVLNAVMVEMVHLVDGQRTENVHYYRNESGWSIPEMVALANDLVTYWDVNWKGWYPTTVQLSEVKVTDLQADNAPVAYATSTLPITGTRAGAQLPNNCALVLTKRTAFRGRNYRGRMYFGPLCEPDVTNNSVAGTFVSGAIVRLQGMMTRTIGDEVWNLGVVSRYFNNAPRVTGIITPVVSISSDGVVDSQRRRLPGRGA